MRYVELLFNEIEERKINIKTPKINIKFKDESITSKTLYYLAANFKYLLNYKYLTKEICIEFNQTKFADKITYLILDSLIYYMLKKTFFKIRILICIESKDLNNIHNIGFKVTALYKNLVKDSLINRKLFINEYEKKFIPDRNTYRRLLTFEELQKSNKWPSIVCSEVADILGTYLDDEEWIDNISETVSELVCNVSSHTDGDCLIHIDFSNTMENKKKDPNKIYTIINIGLINYSQYRLFDKIKNNIKDNLYRKDDLLYNKIYKAYEKHKEFFNSKYNEDDFFLVTAFQNKVTTRNLESGQNGTGLTNLIKNIMNKTDDDYSYILSGKNILFFKSQYLNIDNDGFIGFNKEKDYFLCKPSEGVIDKSTLYIPGSAYHLLLVKEEC